jgi:hypothetical protein
MRVEPLMMAVSAAALCLGRGVGAQVPAALGPPSDAVAGNATSGARSPVLAGLLGFVVPGAGHVYAGEPARGLLTLATYVGTMALLTELPSRHKAPAAVAFVGVWGFGVVDGALAAQRHNARRERASRRDAARFAEPLRLAAGPTVRGPWLGVQLDLPRRDTAERDVAADVGLGSGAATPRHW